MNFEKYLKKISENHKPAIKVEWLTPDEKVDFEFTNKLYDINVDLSVNYQNGSRRSCTITLNNDHNVFPINFNNIWIGQKFKLWMGIYIDDETPYYIPQGVFYISNPNDVFKPDSRTVKINGVDKWAYLDGTLNGVLSGIYQTNIGVDLYDATKSLLSLPLFTPIQITNENIEDYFDVSLIRFKYDTEIKGYVTTSVDKGSFAKAMLTAKQDIFMSFKYGGNSIYGNTFDISINNKIIESLSGGYISIQNYFMDYIIIREGQSIVFLFDKDDTGGSNEYYFKDIHLYKRSETIDPVMPLISPAFRTKKIDINGSETDIYRCPYTAKVERGKTYADILLEYANILCAHIYYDVNGRLVITPMIDTADDITDINKEIVWEYAVDEKSFLGLSQTYNFEKVYNDIIVLGNIVNGYQFKARVQNRNPKSDTCVQKIGVKTKPPIEDNQYYSDQQCEELAIYHAKIDTILQKSGDIDSIALYHLDVNKLVTVSTPNNSMDKELFLITGFNLNTSGTMTVNVTSVNVLKDFTVIKR